MRARIATAAQAALLAGIVLVTLPAPLLAPDVRADPGAGAGADVPEPAGLWTGPMLGPTPRTLAGAAVVNLAGLEALMAGGKPLLIDVGPADRKPEGFPRGRPWMPSHRSIPGAVWMPGAGTAPLAAGREALMARRIAELTGGDRARPIVVFCRPRCWGSWNAGKRLVTLGYTRVNWFPAGINAWQETHETAVVKPDTVWSGGP
jgi:PQQ-dependent catabolism-associated CXXCW motif protein